MRPDVSAYQVESRHLSFEGYDKSEKTVQVIVSSKSDHSYLGDIEYCPAWRQYVYSPSDQGIILAHSCLLDLAALIDWLNKEQRKKPQGA